MTSGIPTVKALPGFWWKSVFISGKQGNEGEQGNKDNIREKGTYENNKFSTFIFFWGGGGGGQGNKPGTCITHSSEGLTVIHRFKHA